MPFKSFANGGKGKPASSANPAEGTGRGVSTERLSLMQQQRKGPEEKTSNLGVGLFSCAVFTVAFALVFVLCLLACGDPLLPGLPLGLVAGVLAAMGVHTAQEWERVVVLRLGAFNRVSGPGLFWTIPFVEQNTVRVDMRVRASTFYAEETLTSDLVPINADAALFWVVFDPKAASLEVNDFSTAVELAAQTALREAIGRLSVAQVAIKRQQLDREIETALAQQVAEWGVTVLKVEVRDILLPKDLQETMSAEAQAEQRLKARMALAEGEATIAEMLADAANVYGDAGDGLRLRAMHLLFESIKETGGTVVVPSSFAEGLGDVLPDGTKDFLRGK